MESDIKDLTTIVQKISIFFNQDMEGDQILILANKAQAAIRGLEVLKTAYTTQEAKRQIIEEAIQNLRSPSLQMINSIILIGQQVSHLNMEIADLRIQLDCVPKLLKLQKKRLRQKKLNLSQII